MESEMMKTEMIDSMEQSKQMDFTDPPFLPADLSAWVAKETLVNLVLSLVPTVEEAKLRVVVGGTDFRPLPPRMLLGLTIYGYAVGIYSSQLIAQKARQDEVFRYLCAHRPPDGEDIRRFRNRHRQVIAQCLATVCLLVWKVHRSQAESRRTACSLRSLEAGPVDALTHTEIICEVMERLHRAEVEDNSLAGEGLSTLGPE
jgi:transposase